MKADELRIGNIVTVNNIKGWPKLLGKPVIVTGISETPAQEGFEDSKYSVSVRDLGKYPRAYHQFDQFIEGVELSKEILEKIGFVQGRDNASVLPFDPRMAIIFIDWNYAECDIAQDEQVVSFKNSHIKYVHQLQNLYFALSGKELTFKL